MVCLIMVSLQLFSLVATRIICFVPGAPKTNCGSFVTCVPSSENQLHIKLPFEIALRFEISISAPAQAAFAMNSAFGVGWTVTYSELAVTHPESLVAVACT